MNWEKLERAWARRPRMSRGQKTIRNFLCIALMLTLFWGLSDYPLPTTELEFRRMERQNLLPKSEIVFLSEKEDAAFVPLEGPELVVNGRWAVGRFDGKAVMAYLGDIYPWNIWEIPLEADGPTVLPLACQHINGGAYGYWVEEGPVPIEEGGGYRYTHHNFTPLLLLDVPEGTARAELMPQDNEGTVHAGEGWNLGNGMWLVGLMHGEYENRHVWYDGCPYTLRLYGEEGELLLEQSGTIPDF